MVNRETWMTRWTDRVIEAGWLLALVFTPYFFSLLTARHFEPDKAMALRSIVLIMLAAWAIKTVERGTVLREKINWQAWRRAPLALPALLFAGVFVIATLTSVRPSVSWWGSYQRGQGTYTNLSYIALFALIVGNLRTRPQVQRLITTIILTGVSVSLYGIVQHLGLDPLPWKGNVITRISSTMGNSIFVAAYLIMVVPLVLYRLVTSIADVRAAPAGDNVADWSWLGFTGLLLFGQQSLLLGILKFMVAVRPATGDFRFWWAFPLGLAIIAGTFALLSSHFSVQPPKKWIGFALGALGFWLVALLLTVAAGSTNIVIDSANSLAGDYWVWLLLGVAGVGGFFTAGYFLPRRATAQTRAFALGQVFAYSIALILILLAIFFSQSRGPWIGGMAGIGVFVLLLLIRLIQTGREQAWPSLPRIRAALWSTIGLGVVLAGLLITFNLSNAPVFEQLRSAPYVGRLGRLLETDDGTGRVRTLIWFGDDKGGGAVGLLQSNWLRTLTFGHGPETMFTAYNPFYPPELARYEARGASPDRSHQAWLDELITKGALGLLSYFFMFGSAAALALKQMRRSRELHWQALSIAALAAITAHFVEVLVGIPIVSTLTMLWTMFGLVVIAGLLEGLTTLEPARMAVTNDTAARNSTPVMPIVPQLLPATAAAPMLPAQTNRTKTPTRAGSGRNLRAGSTPRSAGRDVAAINTAARKYRWTYALILLLALGLAWSWNLRNNYADMYLNWAQSFTPRNVSEEAFAYGKLLRAVEIDPQEDYYYLQLGNSLLRLTVPYKLATQQTFDTGTAPRSNQALADLFADRGSEDQRVLWLVQQNSVEQMLRYTDLVLQQAYAINPTNKDHPANLGRLHSLWARRANGGADHLQQAVDWLETARVIAPNDATILNELATTLAYQNKTAEAETAFKESIALDPRYAETYARLGELYRVNGRLPEAAQQFAAAVERNRSILEADVRQLDPILASLKREPQALQRVRDAFEQQKQRYDEQQQTARAAGNTPVTDARFLSQLGRVRAAGGDAQGARAAFDEVVQLEPNNLAYRQQYTVALSDTLQYDAALQQGRQALQLARQQQAQQQVAVLQQLIDTIKAKAGG